MRLGRIWRILEIKEGDNTLRNLENSSYPAKAKFSNCFILCSRYFPTLKGEHELFVFLLTKNNTTTSPGFLARRFNNLQRAALSTSSVQYDQTVLNLVNSSCLWWIMLVVLTNQKVEIFWMNNNVIYLFITGKRKDTTIMIMIRTLRKFLLRRVCCEMAQFKKSVYITRRTFINLEIK